MGLVGSLVSHQQEWLAVRFEHRALLTFLRRLHVPIPAAEGDGRGSKRSIARPTVLISAALTSPTTAIVMLPGA